MWVAVCVITQVMWVGVVHGGTPAREQLASSEGSSVVYRLVDRGEAMLEGAMPEEDDLTGYRSKLTLDPVPVTVKKPVRGSSKTSLPPYATELLLDVVLDSPVERLKNPYPEAEGRGTAGTGRWQVKGEPFHTASEARRQLAVSEVLPESPAAVPLPVDDLSAIGFTSSWGSAATSSERDGVAEHMLDMLRGDPTGLPEPLSNGVSVSVEAYSENLLRASGYIRATILVDAKQAKLKSIPHEVVFALLIPSAERSAWANAMVEVLADADGLLPSGDRFNVASLGDDSLKVFSVDPIPARKLSLSKASRFLSQSDSLRRAPSTDLRELLSRRSRTNRARTVIIVSPPLDGHTEDVAAGFRDDLSGCAGDLPKVHVLQVGVEAASEDGFGALAELSGGKLVGVGSPENLCREISRVIESDVRPVLLGMRVIGMGPGITDVVPSVIPVVYPGRPVVVYGRFTRADLSRLWVGARGRGGLMDMSVEVDARSAKRGDKRLEADWARLERLGRLVRPADDVTVKVAEPLD